MVVASVDERLLYRDHEAAEQLGISRSKMRELMRRGDIRVVRLGASVRITRDELKRFITTLQAGGAE